MNVNNLKQMNYRQFGKLRFLDFFPQSDTYSYDGDEGGTESGIGYACRDGYAFNFFSSPVKSKRQTAEILLNFDDECPENNAHALLNHLGFDLRKGMSKREIVAAIGVPQSETDEVLTYVIGKIHPYYLRCNIDQEDGLFRIWICRKDLADQQTE